MENKTNIIDTGKKDLRLEALIKILEQKGILTEEEALQTNLKGNGVKFKEIEKAKNDKKIN